MVSAAPSSANEITTVFDGLKVPPTRSAQANVSCRAVSIGLVPLVRAWPTAVSSANR